MLGLFGPNRLFLVKFTKRLMKKHAGDIGYPDINMTDGMVCDCIRFEGVTYTASEKALDVLEQVTLPTVEHALVAAGYIELQHLLYLAH